VLKAETSGETEEAIGSGMKKGGALKGQADVGLKLREEGEQGLAGKQPGDSLPTVGGSSEKAELAKGPSEKPLLQDGVLQKGISDEQLKKDPDMLSNKKKLSEERSSKDDKMVLSDGTQLSNKRGPSEKRGTTEKKELPEEKSAKFVDSDRMSDAGSDRASIHSLSRFSDVGSDPLNPADVSGRYGLAASLSRVAAWREKRNWIDHLAAVPSPKGKRADPKAVKMRKETERGEEKRENEGEGDVMGGLRDAIRKEKESPRGMGLLAVDRRAGSAERAKMLHDKLMSPERRKKTPLETREKVRL
jgi:hypothetical protein